MAGMTLAVMWLLTDYLKLPRYFYVILAMLCLLTLSRSSSFLLLILFLVNNRIDLKSKVTYLGISFVLVTLVIGFLINRFDINPALLSRLDLFSGKSSELVLDHDRGGNGRIGVLEDYIKLIERRPMLGYGAGYTGSKTAVHTAAHNWYILLSVDYGLPVAVIVVVFMFIDLIRYKWKYGLLVFLYFGIFYHDIFLIRSLIFISFFSYVRDLPEHKEF